MGGGLQWENRSFVTADPNGKAAICLPFLALRIQMYTVRALDPFPVAVAEFGLRGGGF